MAQVVAATPLLQLPRSANCSSLKTPFAAFAIANCAAGLGFAFALRSDYRRQARAAHPPPARLPKLPGATDAEPLPEAQQHATLQCWLFHALRAARL